MSSAPGVSPHATSSTIDGGNADWWRGVSLHVWRGQDGRVRGVVALDAITPEEFIEGFARWEPMLRRLGPEEVSGAVLQAVRPGVIAEVEGGGYRSVKCAVKSRTVRRVVRQPPGPPQVA